MLKVVDNIELANCITHNGSMHADEVFSSAFLELYLGDIKVFRTSNIDNLNINDNILVYDIGRGKFDHHQQDALKRDNDIIYCSFGLLWKEFGKDFLKKYGIEDIEQVWKGIDKDLVEGIDADDNGQFPKIESNYKVKTLPNIIKIFNPSLESGEDESTQFEKACQLAKSILEEEILYINGKIIAENKLKEYLEDISLEDKFVILDKYLPYEDTILNDEKYNNILFVAYPSNRGGYAIKVVPKSAEEKTARMYFPDNWAGLEKEELEKVSGIKGLKFCHTQKFIVSCEDLDTVYKVFDTILK